MTYHFFQWIEKRRNSKEASQFYEKIGAADFIVISFAEHNGAFTQHPLKSIIGLLELMLEDLSGKTNVIFNHQGLVVGVLFRNKQIVDFHFKEGL